MTPKKRSARWLAYLAVLGPGLLTASAGNDAGGIATYSQMGAAYQYRLLWLLFIITFALIVVQEMNARMGAVTGKGLSDLIRENFGVRWAVLAMLALVMANTLVVISNVAGIAASLDLFHLTELLHFPSRFVTVPLFVGALTFLLIRGNYFIIERGLLVLAALFLAYPIAAFTVHPPWGEIVHSMLVPSPEWLGGLNQHYMSVAIAIIGTTIAPWMTFFLQASIVDKGVRKQDLPLRRFDVIVGSITAPLIAFFIVVTTAVTLHVSFGAPQFNDAGDAAAALQHLVGGLAPYLFGAGLFGASVLGASAVPLTTAYAVTEAFGWERGLDHRLHQAPMFFGLLIGTLVTASLVVLATPREALFRLIIVTQVINGMLLPIILVFMLLLSNNRRLMGDYVNSKVFNVIAWGTVALVIGLTVVWFGIEMFG
ncbi:MAG: NRAMP family divalent metal transporter [Armatimonadota bacterium]